MTLKTSKRPGKEGSPETGDHQSGGALKSRIVTIDHVIILIVVIVLSITIINTYSTAGFHRETVKDPGRSSAAQVNPSQP